MYGHFLGLDDAALDKPLYRIFSVSRLYDLFDHGQNGLVRPKLWEDPFENFILKSRVRAEDGSVGTFGFANDLYGQCWTLQPRSDAMWRIYSPKSDGVRVRSTPRKLLADLAAGLGDWAHIQAFIGRVEYLSTPELMTFGKEIFQPGWDHVSIAKTLLIKRTAFRHEHEVRLIYLERSKSTHDVFRYAFDAHSVIDQIMIDPRMTKADAIQLKREIVRRTKFQGPIKRSLLYQPPDGLVFPVG